MIAIKLQFAIGLLSYSIAAQGCALPRVNIQSYPPLMRDGKMVPSVCGTAELQALREQFVRYNYRDANTAWKAVITLLCGSITKQNTQFVKNMAAPKLKFTSEYTGQDNPNEVKNINNEMVHGLFARGIAYDASIANLPNGVFRVIFHTNEVCAESRTFKHVGKRWIIVETGEACD